MPISFDVAKHSADWVNDRPLERGLTATEVFHQMREGLDDHPVKSIDKLLHFSIADVHGIGANTRIAQLIPNANGFVNTLTAAYNGRHALVLRPDDVWLAILSQFSLYVNAHAEILGANFGGDEGQRGLRIQKLSEEMWMDLGGVARDLVGIVEKNVVDPELRAWAMPTFSTTTFTDTTVASVLFMSALHDHSGPAFEEVGGDCGIPRVTLEGEKADWEDILGRLERLKWYGVEAIAWYHLLRPVLVRFVRAFEEPEGAENVEFWAKVVNSDPGAEWPSYYSGWINAFMAFGKNGEWVGNALVSDLISDAADTLTAPEFWSTYLKNDAQMLTTTWPVDDGGGSEDSSSQEEIQKLVMDGTPYHLVDSVPPGYAVVDVTIEDQVTAPATEYKCSMYAGMVGMRVSTTRVNAARRKAAGIVGTRKHKVSADIINNTVSPALGWWIFDKKSEVEAALSDESRQKVDPPRWQRA
ncbi:hypothetical protein R3P38DRAFT_3560173 [Favolaschia claudopus]|uniref:Uncharacterized protein n=1 Tax=Favolaschia claudopus TaxID=2862362 RepID=A0AAW0AWX3_9AGAR